MDYALLRAFLNDCLDHPDDDARRLIFADWLQEVGETEAERARGEFVALQTRLALREWADEDDAERIDRARAWELECRYRPAWVGDLAAAGFADIDLSSGFVEVALPAGAIERPLLERLADTDQWRWVRRVSVDADPGDGGLQNAAAWLPQLPEDSPLAGVRQWRMMFQGFAEEHAIALRERLLHPGLQSLELESCALPPWNLQYLLARPLPQLRRLALDCMYLTADAIRPVLTEPRFERLDDLTIYWNDDHDLTPIDGLATAPFRDNLRSLVLDHPLGDAGLSRLWQLDLPALRKLELPSMVVDSAQVAGNWYDRLESLHLGEPGFPGELPPMPRSVRSLSFHEGALDPEHLPWFSNRENVPTLRDLRLTGMELAQREIRQLTRPADCPRLRTLDLHDNLLNDAALRVLAKWPGLRSLHRLNLSGNPVEDAGVRALLASPHLPLWCKIDLRECGLSETMRTREIPTLSRPIWV